MSDVATVVGGFEEALRALKDGKKAQRSGWNGKHMYVTIELPNEDVSDMWLRMRTSDGKYVPWLASQTDVLAGDWMVL